ncbi:MAG: hypothetical protein PHT03_01545 [Bacilli bacterium]|nr:hypothetical protein [Bacilli bacterium]
MIMKNHIIKKTIGSGKLKINLLASGDIFSITYDAVQVSMYRASTLAGGLANLYLRLTAGDFCWYTPLIGVNSPATAEVTANSVIYRGCFAGGSYTAALNVSDSGWFWTVDVAGDSDKLKGEVFYGQDVCLNAANLNEAYVAQYLDHRPFSAENGYHIITKQNQGPALTLQQGALTATDAYATDGFDFFGTEYKRTNIPRALRTGVLPSEVYQYELSYLSFKTPSVPLKSGIKAIFYAMVKEEATATNLKEIQHLYQKTKTEAAPTVISVLSLKPVINWQNPYPYLPFSKQELNSLFPERELEESVGGDILSWFSLDGAHYMSGAKEDYLERPGGHIIVNRALAPISDKLIASTNYIFGVFNSQICFGNTQFNRLLTYNKTPLNILKTSGQRLFVKIKNEYRLLALPAVYQMSVNSAAWYYKIEDDILTVETAASANEPRIVLEVRSKRNRPYDFLLTCELVMADIEYVYPIEYQITDNVATVRFSETTLTAKMYPEYFFRMHLNTEGAYQFFRDELFFPDNASSGNNLLTAKIDSVSAFSVDIEGVAGMAQTLTDVHINNIKAEYHRLYREEMNHFVLSVAPDNVNYREIKKMNYLVYWYLHNGLIHYAAPHGLEQYGGGAWGTRDVCQGPSELFAAFKRYDLIRKIILTVYGRQFYETGDWPQWFMFDRFRFIQADSSHGDIIVWPLYLLGKYLKATGDVSVLKQTVPYTEKATGKAVNGATVSDHIMRQLDTIEANLIPGTALSAYGGGDWNDTLQPKDSNKKQKMASGWTVALTIEALEAVSEFIDSERVLALANRMKKDYNKYLIKDRIPVGFVEFADKINYLLHPADRETGIKYRLLSFNRGMIAELFPEDDLAFYLEAIDRYLINPDGVRLMDAAVEYRGGNPQIFMRAETAANFGREIGLLYIHAHLRYCEAMSKLGEAERLFTGLKTVNPILIGETVKNALTRQSNVYFSSSDAAFKDRYEANREFEKVRRGEIPVKGGWRLYSSGPGIWLYQLIANFLGIKQYQGELYIDPVLPQSLNGLQCRYCYHQHLLDITYDVTGTSGVEYLLVNDKKIANNTALTKYRRSGVIVPRSSLQEYTKIIVKM